MARPVQTAEILAVGSELLGLHRLDTNSLFLTGRLNDIGIDVHVKAIVGDDAQILGAVVGQALARADVVITTGGLGPTADDLTREAVATVLNLPLEENAEVLAAIQARFARRRIRMPETNRKQAAVPRGATVLANSAGTAPGLWIEAGEQIVVLLPGPPRELEPMFDTSVAPRLQARSAGRRVRRRVIRVASRPESVVEEIAHPIYGPLAAGEIPIETTILAAPGQIELHLSARGVEIAAMDAALDRGVAALAAALEPAVVSVDGRTLEVVAGDLLRERGWRVAVAESCTAGLVLGRLTEVPGSSAWVIGGVVAYDNDVKRAQLDVSADLLAAHGAVSEPVAEAMAAGVRSRLVADVGVAVTGIAGPGGGTPAKPVGTVVVSVATPAGSSVRTFLFGGDRQMIRTQSVVAALDMLRREVGSDREA
jgi:competence/damage-inducible protein CinA-like protein